jgi:hypothetical protein
MGNSDYLCEQRWLLSPFSPNRMKGQPPYLLIPNANFFVQTGAVVQQSGERSVEKDEILVAVPTGRRCGNCGKTEHNVRSCQEAEETFEKDSEAESD